MAFLQSIYSKISGTSWTILGAIVAGVALLLKGRSQGVQQERQKQVEAENESLRIRIEVSEDINAMSDDDIDEQLREYIKKRDG